MTTINPQIQETQQTASTINMKKTTSGQIIIKLSPVINRNILKAARKKSSYIKIRMRLIIEKSSSQKTVEQHLKVLKEKTVNLEFYTPRKYFSKTKVK